MDGVPGFEPGLVESKSTVLPLDYTPELVVEVRGVEPLSTTLTHNKPFYALPTFRHFRRSHAVG